MRPGIRLIGSLKVTVTAVGEYPSTADCSGLAATTAAWALAGAAGRTTAVTAATSAPRNAQLLRPNLT
ncbi:hypothetical protein Sya03_59690 [Spirilliplanes yamanashiensis]|uniref:Uncharacterized protein n=1 Tax=Spirilliplanes yamanashiensis TaxID=42233 RepID=A0A8J3YF97_9ACTN|nr:hypothetical protein Sya03_59690 [Spirilliplanes yamanashiensis]